MGEAVLLALVASTRLPHFNTSLQSLFPALSRSQDFLLQGTAVTQADGPGGVAGLVMGGWVSSVQVPRGLRKEENGGGREASEGGKGGAEDQRCPEGNPDGLASSLGGQ